MFEMNSSLHDLLGGQLLCWGTAVRLEVSATDSIFRWPATVRFGSGRIPVVPRARTVRWTMTKGVAHLETTHTRKRAIHLVLVPVWLHCGAGIAHSEWQIHDPDMAKYVENVKDILSRRRYTELKKISTVHERTR